MNSISGTDTHRAVTTYIYIIGDSQVNIWGLSGRERLLRKLRDFDHINVVDDLHQIPAQAPVLMLCGDCLFDRRILDRLIAMEQELVLKNDDGCPVAIRIHAGEAASILADFHGEGDGRALSALPACALGNLDLGVDSNLKKNDQSYVWHIDQDSQRTLEWELFASSYKGVTDLVTKWLWPVPAFWATRLCVRLGLRPNHITLFSLLLAVLAGVAFWQGYFGPGLVMGWLMTFLDTVDGKLARVTLTSSCIGDVLDHGLDLVHPPLWYLAWGIGLAGTGLAIPDLTFLMWLMLAGYIGGRLCEGAFNLWAAPFTIFMWRPLDSYHRLITARRNPNLILLTISWLLGWPDIGLWAVVIWHLMSTVFLTLRVAYGILCRYRHGPLESWLEVAGLEKHRDKLAVRVFTRLPIAGNDRAVTD